MKDQLKKLFPHLIAVLAFVILSLGYFFPVLEGKELPQGDNSHAKGAAQELVEFEKNTGEKAQWTNSMFGGMPAYQIKADSSKNLFRHINNLSHIGLPYTTAAMLFLYFLGFYLLMLSLRMNPWLALGGSIAFALGSYNIIIIIAGHITKAYAIALMAPVIAGVLWAFNRNRLVGALLTAIALGLEIAYNHVQITYYLLLMILILGAFKLADAIIEQQKATSSEKDKPVKAYFKTVSVLIIAAVLAILPNITNLWTTYEYGKFSIRGKSELSTTEGQKEHGGLDKSYALDWSYGLHETPTLLIPNIVGGASEAIGMDNPAIQNLPAQIKEAVAGQSKYWGGRIFTSGPVYAGAVVCFLFFIGAFFYRGREKWWLITATIFSIMLAWGKNFLPLTDLMFYYFPMYNKFRTVEMALVIASFTMPLMGFLGLKELYERPELIRQRTNYFLAAVGLTGGVSLLLYLTPTLFYSFISPQEAEMFASISSGDMAQGYALLQQGIVDARIVLFKSDALRSFIFIMLASASLWFYSTNKLSARYMIGGIIILILIDLWSVDKRYLNAEHFISKSKARQEFALSEADKIILNDKTPGYRVMSLYRNPFNEVGTSYHHHSVGGYHGAKLRRYQDVIDAYLGREWSTLTGALKTAKSIEDITTPLANMPALNMLNTRYLIFNPDAAPLTNNYAMGAAWFVADTHIAGNADEALKLIGQVDLSQVAVVEQQFANSVASLDTDSVAGSVELDFYAPNRLRYKSISTQTQLAVFSEIYYPAGWSARIDGESAEILRVNYLLRGLVIPAGHHDIEFSFEPQSFRYGQVISTIGSVIIVLLAALTIWLKRKGKLKDKEE